MFGLLLLLINATAAAVPISTIPFVYTTPLMMTIDSPILAQSLTSSGEEKPRRILPRTG
jgi:ribose 1,5-bisphosphokinase PhnN